nr:calmodulin-like protein 9 [Ipomoea batatas]
MVDPVTITVIASLAAAANSAASFGKIVAEILEKNSKPQNGKELNAEVTKTVAEISSMMGTGSFPVFDGNDYETWRHMMKALLISYDLWDLVENGYKAKAFKEDGKKKDALAMMIILLGVDKSVRRCTLNANNSKEAWDAIQNKYQAMKFRNSEKSMVPSPSASTSFIISCRSASLGFSPNDLIIVPSSFLVMQPSPSLSNRLKAALNSAI